MRKIKYIMMATMIYCMSGSIASATVYLLNDAKITHIESYGTQITFYFDVNYPANNCRSFANGAVALVSTTDAGKAQLPILLTAAASDKQIDMHVTDAVCSGDRPTISHFSVTN